jgi:hypothetical protein
VSKPIDAQALAKGTRLMEHERPPGPSDYLFDWITWLSGAEQRRFAEDFAALRAHGSAAELTDLMIRWHNTAMQRLARRRRVEREDEGEIV